LLKRGLSISPTCCFCSKPETIDHLFFECDFSAQVWNTIKAWIGLNINGSIWSKLLAQIRKKTRGKNGLAMLRKVAIAATVYNIWKARNHMVFQQIRLKESDVAIKIQTEVMLRVSKYKVLTQRQWYSILSATMEKKARN
jgi:hypothetical protein